MSPSSDDVRASLESHGHHHHDHRLRARTDRALVVAAGLNGFFFLVEAGTSYWTESLALASDAVHMVGDVGALLMALGAARIARLPRTDERTFGLVRAETLGAFANGMLLALGSLLIVGEGVDRLLSGIPEVPGVPVLVVSLVGLFVNVVSAWVLWRAASGGPGAEGGENLNLRGAMGHMLADAMGSVGAIIAAAFLLAGFGQADAVVSLLIAVMVAVAGASLMRDAGRVLLQLPPVGMAVPAVRADLASVPKVKGVHELHIWSLDGTFAILTVHLVIERGADPIGVRAQACRMLSVNHGIRHVTLQVEVEDEGGDEALIPHP